MEDFVSERAEQAWALSGLPLSASKVSQGASLRGSVAPVTGCKKTTYAAAGKRVLDLTLVMLALPVVLPVIMVCALLLWLEGGLPFYSQERLGQNGKRFRIYKLRTMVRDADARLQGYLQKDPKLRHEWETTQKLKSDPRITRMGRILRMTSLDELPQIWNVFTGEMSLVGPRPMLPEQLPLYGEPFAYFAVKPGITGIWQVSTRNESSFAARATADASYLRQMGVRQDLRLLWRTIGVVARGTGY
ncbi:sugar transferase [Pseudophaeobacter flagellatus]|uniref:sugar transferase n=1 Tax=Pseudophaeobacter flagellatus TaxID=2899119 RepID=UPI001E376EE9|nr:sugar transferase [Pseudophaeobacter flagellatus]MCD9148340.1 sugar transferase [Pseudophaeobacter flagellatus]